MHAPARPLARLRQVVLGLALSGLCGGCFLDELVDGLDGIEEDEGVELKPSADGRVRLSEEEWQTRLSEEEFAVLRGGRTERAFTGALWQHDQRGTYLCAACRLPLYDSRDKFDAGDGRPSFMRAIDGANIDASAEWNYGTLRIQLTCARCGSHLGYAYTGGPSTSGMRHSLNSLALDFETPRETARRVRREAREHDRQEAWLSSAR
ncbi:MAG: peptide-methionine (R)-S-oxide reductase [Deltaproteobacteria bacterium]|nr:peptide-methionine (R)-S-oxide reductase [Deltaproteobacteria bacterium]